MAAGRESLTESPPRVPSAVTTVIGYGIGRWLAEATIQHDVTAKIKTERYRPDRFDGATNRPHHSVAQGVAPWGRGRARKGGGRGCGRNPQKAPQNDLSDTGDLPPPGPRATIKAPRPHWS